MDIFIVFLTVLAVVAAIPNEPQRIIGGSLTTIFEYPEMVALLFSRGPSGHTQECGGSLLNERAILTAAHCTIGDTAARWRSRVGSSFGNSGGLVYATQNIVNHAGYNGRTLDNDIAIVRTNTPITFSDAIQPARIAGSNYHVADSSVVWASGWGRTEFGGPSQQLRHVQIWTVNQDVCRSRYASIRVVTDNMLCSGWLDVGGRDQCSGDSGGPLFHEKVVIGVCSWGRDCGLPRYPGVNVRVSRYTSWIQQHAQNL